VSEECGDHCSGQFDSDFTLAERGKDPLKNDTRIIEQFVTRYFCEQSTDVLCMAPRDVGHSAKQFQLF
jgi:hypothetical protein